VGQKKNIIQKEVEQIISQCELFQNIIPATNSQAKLILSNLREQLKNLSQLIEEENHQEGEADCPLTKREHEVLSHVANGFTNKEIASALRLSEKTIEYHLSSVYRKSVTSSRTEAVAIAIKNKWIE